jgi:hypothetical protein
LEETDCSLAIKVRERKVTGGLKGGEKTQRLKIPDGKIPVDRGKAKPRHEKTSERPEKKTAEKPKKESQNRGRGEATKKS